MEAAASGGLRRMAYPSAAEDERIGGAVCRRLFEDTWLDARHIEVRVRDRVVRLSGSVRDHLQARYAWDDAWETPGVRGVISDLTVEGPTVE